MQAAVQAGSLQRASSITTSSQQSKVDTSQSKGKKRERTDQSQDPCKRERLTKVEETHSGPLKQDGSVKLEEIANIPNNDGGLTSVLVVDQILQLMLQERDDSVKKSGDAVSRRTLLVGIIAATEEEDYLTRFVQLGGLPVLDDWLQDAHKGRLGDGESAKDRDKGLEELMLTLLKALDKLPVDIDALKGCLVGKSVRNLRSHRNLEIQKKARKLVDTWKKRVDAEMKSSGELKHGLNPLSGNQPSDEAFGVKGRPTVDGELGKSSIGVRPATNSLASWDLKCSSLGVCGSKETLTQISNMVSKDSSVKPHASGENEVLLTAAKEEKSSSTGQSLNSQSWCSVSIKGAGLWKKEVKTSSGISTGSGSTTTALCSHNSLGKEHSTTTPAGTQKDFAGGKQLQWNKMLGIEKVASPLVTEKDTNDNLQSESFSNHRTTVRLPNPGKIPVQEASGGDVGIPASQGSSPGLTESQDPVDMERKTLCDPPVIQSSSASGGLKTANGSCRGAKSSVDCSEEKERACSMRLENNDCLSSDAEQMPDHAGKTMALAACLQVSVLEKEVGSSDTSLELHNPDSNEGVIDLLASVAACEGSEADKCVMGEGSCMAKDFNREPLKHGKQLHEPDHEGDIKETGVSAGDPRVSTSPQGLEERLREDAFDSTSVSSESSSLKDLNCAATKKVDAFASQDGCGGDCSAVRRGSTNEGKGSAARLLPDSHSLSRECQTGIASVTAPAGLDILNCLQEDAKRASTNSLKCPGKISSDGCVAKGGESVCGYYEEDALEVAWQVAKEVEQEVEGYSKPEGQDASTMEPRHDSPAQESATSPQVSSGEDAFKAKGSDQDRVHHCACDKSQETVTEKREETEVDKMPSVRHGEEVDQAPYSLNRAEKSRFSLELVHGSVVDNRGIREAEESVVLKETKQCSAPVVQDNRVDTTACHVQAAEVPAPSQAAALASASNDGNGRTSNAFGRPVFDLNEGFVADDSCHDDAPYPVVNSLVTSDSLAFPPSLPSALAAPIAVVAVTKGGFIPPSKFLRSKAELGWKGSAATSAFRPAEPRRATEPPAVTTGTGTAADATVRTGKQIRNWDIDLNLADERVMEDTCVVSSLLSLNPLIVNTTSCQAQKDGSIGSSSAGLPVNSSPTASRPELDLNRVDGSEESMVPISDWRDAAIRTIRDFDLNDGPAVEESIREEPSQLSHCKNLESQAPVPPRTSSNAELANVVPWYSVANPLHTMVAFTASREESPYTVPTGPTTKNLGGISHTLSPFNGDLYPTGAIMSMSMAGSYSTTMPAIFPHTGFPFESGFPFTSTSYNMSSTSYITSTSSPSYATDPSQLVSAGSVVSPYGRCYPTGPIEVPGAETSASWPRPSLDLNAGPDSADLNSREEGLSMQHVSSLGQLSFQQVGTSSGRLKRKEPEGGFDPFRSGFKQTTWQ